MNAHPLVKHVWSHKQIQRTLKFQDNTAKFSQIKKNPSKNNINIDKKKNLFFKRSLTNKNENFWNSSIFKSRKSLKATSYEQITSALHADELWKMGFKGRGVKVAIFDTGLEEKHPHFLEETVVDRTDWTDENNFRLVGNCLQLLSFTII